MFNIGDRVEVVNTLRVFYRKKGTVISISPHPAGTFYEVELSDGYMPYFSEWEISLVTASAPPIPAKGGVIHVFSVGDNVYLRPESRFNNGRNNNPLNTIGEIVATTTGKYLPIGVQWSNGTNNTYPAEDLQLATGSTPVTHSAKPEPELCPQVHDQKSYDGSSILDITKRMF